MSHFVTVKLGKITVKRIVGNLTVTLTYDFDMEIVYIANLLHFLNQTNNYTILVILPKQTESVSTLHKLQTPPAYKNIKQLANSHRDSVTRRRCQNLRLSNRFAFSFKNRSSESRSPHRRRRINNGTDDS